MSKGSLTSPVQKHACLAYAENPPIKKRVLRKSYHSDVVASRLLRCKRYAEDPTPACKRSQVILQTKAK